MTDAHDPHEPLVAELRALFERVDPVPGVVVQAGKAALGWRRLEADFAELLSDSVLDVEALALARSTAAAIRSVSFTTGERTIDLEIQAQERGRVLRGQISPGEPVTVEAQDAGGQTIASTRADALGRFRLELVGGRTIRLLLRRDEPGAAVVETAWIAV